MYMYVWNFKKKVCMYVWFFDSYFSFNPFFPPILDMIILDTQASASVSTLIII